jgi:2-C-methyl-D-erythritol 4-phosphate cytidylyltransferase
MNHKLWVIIPCAGIGARAKATVPKQYALICGHPMIDYTIAAFLAVKKISSILLCVAKDDVFWRDRSPPSAKVRIAKCGGISRADTVANGLRDILKQGANENDWVLVHDAARCLITPEKIIHLIERCQDDAVGGLLAIPVPDTIKQMQHGRTASTVMRNDKWLAQTPQMFRLKPLLNALQRSTDSSITDEASAMEQAGMSCLLVHGSSQNFKITYPEDFLLARAVLMAREAS